MIRCWSAAHGRATLYPLGWRDAPLAEVELRAPLTVLSPEQPYARGVALAEAYVSQK